MSQGSFVYNEKIEKKNAITKHYHRFFFSRNHRFGISLRTRESARPIKTFTRKN